jgi:hypothetical protein
MIPPQGMKGIFFSSNFPVYKKHRHARLGGACAWQV